MAQLTTHIVPHKEVEEFSFEHRSATNKMSVRISLDQNRTHGSATEELENRLFFRK